MGSVVSGTGREGRDGGQDASARGNDLRSTFLGLRRKPKEKTPVPQAPTILDPSVSAAVRRRRASATAAAGATILTGSQGLTNGVATTKKSLLGI